MRQPFSLPLGLVATMLAALSLTPAASASVRCRAVAESHVLRVLPYSDDEVDLDFAAATVRREGNRILVFNPPFEDPRRAVPCDGPAATVSNTETILFIQTGLSFTTIDLSGGLPAPHTEFRSDLGALGYGFVSGTDGADRWALGGTPQTAGLNLDPSRPDEMAVTWSGLGTDVIVAEPRAGNDSFDASGLRRRDAITIASGGDGDDALIGSNFADGLSGGRGRDLLEGGGGNDELDGRGQDHDRLDCGAGHHDKARLGRNDSVKRCEKVERPGNQPRPPKPPWLS